MIFAFATRRVCALALQAAAAVLLTGCAGPNAQVDHAPSPSVVATVTSASAGFGVTRDPKSGFIVHVHEFNGANSDLVWKPDRPLGKDAIQQFESCLADIRWKVRFVEPESRATPHFVQSLVGHCVESLSLPAYQETPQNDAIQYVVELSTGNLNEHVAPLGGTPLWAAGIPFLGGRRLIKSIATNGTAVVADVNACADDAARKGVFDTSTAKSGSMSNWQFESSQTTIRPMLDRFDQCLRGKDYLVEDVQADGDARVAPSHR